MIKTITEANFTNKRVIMRVDFNVPMKDGIVQDATRIQAALPSIIYILKQNARSITLMSHLGDPSKDSKKEQEKMQKNGLPFNKEAFIAGKNRMEPVAQKLSELLHQNVHFAPDCVGNAALLDTIENGGIVMLENTRFHPEETSKNSDERQKLALELAKYGEIYVNDAFGTAHRAHASTETIAHLLPSYAGFLIEKEIKAFVPLIENPPQPFIAVIGGAKVSSKIAVLNSLMQTAHSIIIGGGMAFTFLKAQGHAVGNSLIEEEHIQTAHTILENAQKKNITILLPIDFIITSEFSETAHAQYLDANDIPDGYMGLDIGTKTQQLYGQAIQKAASIIWNGPMGVFEFKPFSTGTKIIGEMIAKNPGLTVVGGGDSVAACNQFNLSDKMTHVSTGGGASLELLEGKDLPGITVLKK